MTQEVDLLKSTSHIGGIFRSAPFGADRLAVWPDAAGIATEGMQKMERRCPGDICRKGGKPGYSEPARAGRARCAEPLGQFDPKAPLDFQLARGIGEGLFARPWV